MQACSRRFVFSTWFNPTLWSYMGAGNGWEPEMTLLDATRVEPNSETLE